MHSRDTSGLVAAAQAAIKTSGTLRGAPAVQATHCFDLTAGRDRSSWALFATDDSQLLSLFNSVRVVRVFFVVVNILFPTDAQLNFRYLVLQ